MKFFQRNRLFVSGDKISTKIWEVAPDTLTINPNFNKRIFMETLDGDNTTPFREIGILPFREAHPDIIYDFNIDKLTQRKITKSDFATMMFNILCDTIKETWDPDKFHVIPHSSGYDTRLISAAIIKLKNELGDKWLGDILFIEAAGESKEFLEIMKLQGWDESQYMVYNSECKDPFKYNDFSFDFRRSYKSLNGLAGFPVNVWYDTILWLQEQKIIPDDDKIQCYTGYGANESTHAVYNERQSLDWYFWWHYYLALSIFNLKGEWVHPFWSFDYLKALYCYGTEHIQEVGKNNLSSSLVILEEVAPETLHIKKLVTIDVRKLGYRNISDEMVKICIEDFGKSWLGKHNIFGISVTKDINYCEWWGLWTFASLIDHFIETGRTVCYGK